MFDRTAEYMEEMRPRTMALFGLVVFAALCVLLAVTR
jgi:hypothetical protein